MNVTADKVKEAGFYCDQLMVINKQYQSYLTGISKFKGSAYKVGRVIENWISGVFGISGAVFIIAFCRIVYIYPIEPPDPRYVLLNELLKPVGMCFLIMGILYFPVALFWGIKNVKKNIDNSIKIAEGLKEKMDDIIQENREIISIIPDKYRYPMATDFFTEVLENGRADSLKEAMNLYEEQLHRWKMESKMEQILKNQQIDSTALWTYIITDSFFR